MAVWRLQTRTANEMGEKIADYCIQNSILAMGWSLKEKDLTPQAIEEKKSVLTFEDYAAFVDKYALYGGLNANVRRLYSEVQENDLVWIRTNGIYYLGRVTAHSRWHFNQTVRALRLDAANQVSNIQWYEVGDESDVPGAIATAFIRGNTLQRINKSGIWEYSQLVFNEKAHKNVYPYPQFTASRDVFYNLLSTNDCEDLLCLWLYAQFGYIVIPSTNKKATECYECVLKDPKTGKKIYPQVKKGATSLYKENYEHLDGEVWLFTTKGHVYGEDKNGTIHVADPETLFAFVGSDAAKNILPTSILSWYKML